MAAKHYGAAELVELLAHLAKPFTDAWRDEGGPGWWARTKARAAGWLRRTADRLSPPAPAVTLAVTIQLPTPAPAPEPTPTPEPAPAAPMHTCGNSAPATPAKRTRKPAAVPRAKAKPVPAAARTTRPKAKAKPAPAPKQAKPAAARKPARRKPAAT